MVELITLELEGFGKFDKEKVVSFGKGINFVTGLNEAGKSTILEAIMASIFKYTRGQIDPFFCWKNSDICRTSLTYKTDKGETFKISSDYRSGRRKLDRIEKGKTREIAAVDKNIDPYLKEHFGFDDKKVFENTAFIRQSQMAILEDNSVRNKIKDMIEEVFAGRSEASATKALAKIKKIGKDSGKEIEIIDEGVYELKEKLKQAEDTKSRVNVDSESFKSIDVKMNEKSQNLIRLKENYKMFQEKEEISKKVEVLSEKIRKIDKILLGIKENGALRDKIIIKKERYIGFDTISSGDYSDIKEMIKNIEQLESNLIALKTTDSHRTIVEEELSLIHLIMFIVGLILSITIIGLIIGIPVIMYSYPKIKRRKERKIQDSERESNINLLHEKIQVVNRKLVDKTNKIKGFNKNEFIDKFSDYVRLCEEEKSIAKSISDLVMAELDANELKTQEKDNIRKIESKKTELLNDLSIEKNSLKKYNLINFTQQDFDNLPLLEKEVEGLKEKRTELQASIRTTVSLVESPDDIKEKLDALEEKKKSLSIKIEEHELANKFLEIAESEVHHKFTPAIEKNSKTILKEITNDRYSELKLEEDTLNVKIKVPETKEFVDVTYLSQGAKDQLYFTLRTVMSDLLSAEANLPLILDDPFHNFDDNRLIKTIEILKQIGKSKQIILISHRPYHKSFKSLSENILELK